MSNGLSVLSLILPSRFPFTENVAQIDLVRLQHIERQDCFTSTNTGTSQDLYSMFDSFVGKLESILCILLSYGIKLVVQMQTVLIEMTLKLVEVAINPVTHGRSAFGKFSCPWPSLLPFWSQYRVRTPLWEMLLTVMESFMVDTS